MTSAWSGPPPANRDRPTLTGAPGNWSRQTKKRCAVVGGRRENGSETTKATRAVSRENSGPSKKGGPSSALETASSPPTTHLVGSKDSGPIVGRSLGQIDDSPTDGQLAQSWGFDRYKGTRCRARCKPSGQCRHTGHVLQVRCLGGKVGENRGCVVRTARSARSPERGRWRSRCCGIRQGGTSRPSRNKRSGGRRERRQHHETARSPGKHGET